MSSLRFLAIIWLVFLSAFAAGMYVYHTQSWPYQQVFTIHQFITGGAGEDLSIHEMIANDLDLKPNRHIATAGDQVGSWMHNAKSLVTDEHEELEGLDLRDRRLNPRMFLADTAASGYRLIYGAFDFKDGLHGAILLDHKGNIVNQWLLSQEGVPWDHQPDANVFPHGLMIGRDGSLIVAFDHGASLGKFDYCGNKLWLVSGAFHHSIAEADEESFWTWKDDAMIRVRNKDGEILQWTETQAVMDANPDIDIFGILQDDTSSGSTWADVAGSHWHGNDIEPLTADKAQFFPGFSVGDLLVSLRSPNLIYVFDPETLKVKWWRQGLSRRQHDPDWNVDGSITIFNNNMHRGYSNIQQINPSNFQHSIALAGEDYQFYTWARGKHQRMPDGGFLITSPEQGRVFETNADGQIVFEFLNTFQEDQYMKISEAQFLPLDYFQEIPTCN